MRRATILCMCLAIFAGTMSCGQNRKKKASTETIDVVEIVVDGHNARNSLDYEGTYEGVLPCADCPGIGIELTIEKDTYVLTRVYLERSSEPYVSSGRYEWDATGSKIILKGEEPNLMFFVGENKIYQLDLNGDRITGELAENYRLDKVE